MGYPQDRRCPCKQWSWGKQRAATHSEGYLCPPHHLLQTGGTGTEPENKREEA